MFLKVFQNRGNFKNLILPKYLSTIKTVKNKEISLQQTIAMKWRIIFLAFLNYLPVVLHAQSQLLRIEEAGKYGYINMDGEIMIPPKYVSANHFSEGLAAVRLTDKFGFIDSTGQWKIPPIYDLAGSFHKGQAKVWLGETEQLISPTGVSIPIPKYKGSISVPDDFTVLESSDKRFGLIDQNGKIILDTVYEQILWNEDSCFTLLKMKQIDGADLLERGLADYNGVLKIPFGKYENIRAIGDGWFYVVKQNDLSTYQKINNRWLIRSGKRKKESGILKLEDGKFRPISGSPVIGINGDYSDGSIPVLIRDTTIYYYGFLDTTGQVFLSDINFQDAHSFFEGSAFVKDKKERMFYLIDKKGNRLNDVGIKKLLGPRTGLTRAESKATETYFFADRAIVMTADGIAKLSKNGEMQFIKELEGMYFGYLEEERYLLVIPNRDQPKPRRRGIYDIVSEKLLPFRFEMIYPTMYGNKLFEVKENGRMAYVDTSGNIVWQQKSPISVYPYDVTNCIALRKRKSKPKKMHWLYRLVGFRPKAYIGFRKKAFLEKGKRYQANNLYLVNPSKDTLVFDGGLSGSIPLKLQAKDSQGEWKTISYNSRSCGISINGRRELPPDHYWYYRFPKFKGHVKTKFRVIVPYTKKGEPDVPLQLITTFKGGINPAQFWNKYN